MYMLAFMCEWMDDCLGAVNTLKMETIASRIRNTLVYWFLVVCSNFRAAKKKKKKPEPKIKKYKIVLRLGCVRVCLLLRVRLTGRVFANRKNERFFSSFYYQSEVII